MAQSQSGVNLDYRPVVGGADKVLEIDLVTWLATRRVSRYPRVYRAAQCTQANVERVSLRRVVMIPRVKQIGVVGDAD